MALQLNATAVDFARDLIHKREYRINTVWSRNEPSPEQAAAFLKKVGGDEYQKWFLAFDPASADATHYPYGDFQSVHRSGLKDIAQRAALDNQPDIAAAANELLDMIDHFNAC
jgi:hypothetical protein